MYAIYARQSVDRADSISIESQIEFCQYEVRGESYREYIDKGYSGKNTDRPKFQELLMDIEKGGITKVIVYKLDRISRSILDFSNMMELFEEHHVEFISSTEKFDTSTPMGRAMLHICIVFAQLERETIQKRVADAYFSRSQKSFYMGGRVPYGFRTEQTTIQGVKTSKYVIVPQEAAQIKLMYELYSEPYTSYGDILNYFAKCGITNNGKPWERARIADHLRNPIYVKADLDVYDFYNNQGTILANDASEFIGTNGCYLYKGADTGRKSCDLKGQYLVLAPHEGLISSELWLMCRMKCLRNRQVQTVFKAKNSWLAGIIKCRNCGYALVVKKQKTKKARYLLCSRKLNAKACPGCGTIHADEFEDLIYHEMAVKLKEFQSLSPGNKKKADPKTAKLSIELAQAEAQIENLMSKLSSANEVLLSYINTKIVELDNRKQELVKELTSVSMKADADTEILNDYFADWSSLSFDDKRLAANALIQVIHAANDTVQITWRI